MKKMTNEKEMWNEKEELKHLRQRLIRRTTITPESITEIMEYQFLKDWIKVQEENI